jgi:hydrogenase maturation factor
MAANIKFLPQVHRLGCDPHFALAAGVVHQALRDYALAAQAHDRIEMNIVSEWLLVTYNPFVEMLDAQLGGLAERLTEIAEAAECY